MDNNLPNKNPYANPDGTPMKGKWKEFFAWGRQQHLKELDKLPPEEREKRLRDEAEAAKHQNF